MAPTVSSLYTPLLVDDTEALNIRLIRLQPSDDRSAPIHCKLANYRLDGQRSVSLDLYR